MRYFGCGINKIVSVLIRPGAVVRVHNGPLFTCRIQQIKPHLNYAIDKLKDKVYILNN